MTLPPGVHRVSRHRVPVEPLRLGAVATLSEIAQQYGPLPQDEADWLSEVVADWQIIADLSFADLVLWRKVDEGFVAIGHCRPSTGPTAVSYTHLRAHETDSYLVCRL